MEFHWVLKMCRNKWISPSFINGQIRLQFGEFCYKLAKMKAIGALVAKSSALISEYHHSSDSFKFKNLWHLFTIYPIYINLMAVLWAWEVFIADFLHFKTINNSNCISWQVKANEKRKNILKSLTEMSEVVKIAAHRKADGN